MRWHLITGEYPPQPGGVSDYTRLVARGLTGAGDAVHVWAPWCDAETPAEPGITVHRLPDHFGPRGLAALDRGLDRFQPSCLLVQYVPHAFGWKALNVPLVAWLASRARRYCPVWVMFHEVQFPFRWWPFSHAILGTVHPLMKHQVARAATRIFVSTLAWRKLLPPAIRKRAQWLPVPSNLDCQVDPLRVAHARSSVSSRNNARIIGHFGTFGRAITDELVPVLHHALKDDRNVVLLLGRGSREFAAQRFAQNARVVALGALPADEIAASLAACDLLVQPYPDGASCRRGTLMAGLALGLPIITTQGSATEPIWEDEQLVLLVPSCDVQGLSTALYDLLEAPERRQGYSVRARAGYQRFFSLDRTIEVLRAAEP